MAYTMIDSFDFSHKNIYLEIDNYFDSPVMEKVRDDAQVSIYMAKIKSFLASVEQPYIVAVTKRDNKPIGFKLYLKNLEWTSFQTRMLIPDETLNKIQKHSYHPKNNIIPVQLKERYEDHTDYVIMGSGVGITLLHKSNNLYEYPNSGNLGACLETYRTIIVL